MDKSLGNSFPKTVRLRYRKQYQRMAIPAFKKAGSWIVIDVSPNQNSISRLGVTVTRRFGKAHERNRFKRIAREAFRCSLQKLPSGFDIIIKPRSRAKTASSKDIEQELLFCLSKIS